MVENLLAMQETQFQSLDGEDLLEKEILLLKKNKNTKSRGGCNSTGKLTHSGGSIHYYSHFGE